MLLVALKSTSFTICIGPATVISMYYGPGGGGSPILEVTRM